MAFGKIAILFVVAAATVALAAPVEEELYDSKYDHVDVQAILMTDRLRNQYIRCVLGTAPCITGDAKFLRDKFPEAIVTKCKKCTEKQKQFFEMITEWFTKNEPDTWNALLSTVIDRIQRKQ